LSFQELQNVQVGGLWCPSLSLTSTRIDPVTCDILGLSDFESTKLDADVTPLPVNFNTRLEKEHIELTEVRNARRLADL
jgi:hypothetical protein